jgi:competence protein ComEC
MLVLAHQIASAEGAVAMLPTMPRWAFAAMLLGGIWLCLWTSRARAWGLAPFAIGTAGAVMSPVPDVLVTGDGQHLALVRDDGVPVLLRSRSGDFVRSLMSEASAYDGDPLPLEEEHFARCSRDACVADIVGNGRAWRLLAIRSRERIEWEALTQACADADIVVADRRLPKGCTPRWLKLDREALERNGGVAIFLGESPHVESVEGRLGKHPWGSHVRVILPAPAQSEAYRGRASSVPSFSRRQPNNIARSGLPSAKPAQ